MSAENNEAPKAPHVGSVEATQVHTMANAMEEIRSQVSRTRPSLARLPSSTSA
jgi:hypothetical protein